MQVDIKHFGWEGGKNLSNNAVINLNTRINNIRLLHVHTPQISSPGVELILIYTLLYFRSDINH
jgi:hypothetical protein